MAKAPGIEKFLGISRDELEKDDIKFLSENYFEHLRALRTSHPAGIFRALCAMFLEAHLDNARLLEELAEAKRVSAEYIARTDPQIAHLSEALTTAEQLLENRKKHD